MDYITENFDEFINNDFFILVPDKYKEYHDSTLNKIKEYNKSKEQIYDILYTFNNIDKYINDSNYDLFRLFFMIQILFS